MRHATQKFGKPPKPSMPPHVPIVDGLVVTRVALPRRGARKR
jgi:hypothetical protein